MTPEQLAEIEQRWPPSSLAGQDVHALVAEIKRLQDAADWQFCDAQAAHRACEGLEAEVKRLRGIVDNMPRTADGVDVERGMTIYDADGDEFRVISAQWLDTCVVSETYEIDHVRAQGFYSTREAAEAAREKQSPTPAEGAE